MKEDPPPDAKCRDKFLVQSVAVTADKEFSNVPSIWQHVDKAAKSPGDGKAAVQETKIKVVFLPAEGEGQAPYLGTTNGDAGTQPPAYRPPTPDAVTPHHTQPAAPDSPPESRPSDTAEATSSAPIHLAASDDKTVTSTDAIQDLRSKLEKAHAEIARLLRERSEQGPRQRKTDGVNEDVRERATAGTTALGVQQQPIEGVSVQVVAALCLLSFLLAYIFF
ncbi:MAG: phosphatidylinositol-binding protein scs2 [Geoglossum umbratile]|nr:MAG: phosphatidylinositol-binding protein scs2 [Geoglossum umbratile]